MKISSPNLFPFLRAKACCSLLAIFVVSALAAPKKPALAEAPKPNKTQPSNQAAPPPFVVLNVDSGKIVVDTLQLPDQVAFPGQGDSLSKEFAKYWAQLEKQEGMTELKKQMHANDVDKTKIPHMYLADSNLVIFPGWFILRKKK